MNALVAYRTRKWDTEHAPKSRDKNISPRIPSVGSFVSWQAPFEYTWGFRFSITAIQGGKGTQRGCASAAPNSAAILATDRALYGSECRRQREANPNLH